MVFDQRRRLHEGSETSERDKCYSSKEDIGGTHMFSLRPASAWLPLLPENAHQASLEAEMLRLYGEASAKKMPVLQGLSKLR